jgi:hypothetical protein
MLALPAVCSICRQPFAESGSGRRMAHLERGRAFCSDCLWRVDHPEADPSQLAWPSGTLTSAAVSPI